MTKIIVLAGGDSDEREVSLRSGAVVSRALQASGYEVATFDPAQPSTDYEEQLSQADAVFPVLHGKGGEDGTIQAWLEARGIAYVGADRESSALCFDKRACKQALQTAGILMPRGEVVDTTTVWNSPLIASPFVLKPFDGGSSVDTFIIRDPSSIDRTAIAAALSRHSEMLLEELVEGTEITAGVLLDQALPIVEIIPPSDGEFDYENKYNGKTLELCPPKSLTEGTQKQAQQLALRVHTSLRVRDMSRTDMIIKTDGSIYVLELNTLPGMTDQSLLPKAAAVAGYDMPALVTRLIAAALARRSHDLPDETALL